MIRTSASIIRLHLEHHDCVVHIIHNANALRGAIDEHKPDILLVDVMLSGQSCTGIDAVNACREQAEKNVPVLFMSARGDLEARLAAVRAGGIGYFVKPIEMGELIKKIDYINESADTHYRVLVVDDDSDLAAWHVEVLEQAGLETRKLCSPMQILHVLHEFRPDLVLMDLHMPDCSGGELAQIIRQEARFADLPIIFVSSEQDAEKQNSALAQGGDAFLVKPVNDSRLVEAVTNRVTRARQLGRHLQYLDQQDSQTGLINQRALLSHLNTAIDELSGAETASALLFISIDQFWKMRDEVGFAASELMIIKLASILRREIGPAEHIARVGNASFVTLLPGVSPGTAQSVSNRLLKVIASQTFKAGTHSFPLCVSIGVAPLADIYQTGDDWLSGAALACDIARSTGSDKSYLHQPRSDKQIEHEQHSHCANLIRSALDTDALSCVYQPIACLRGNPSEKYDVLLRMQNPEGGEVLPARFLPVAEAEGLTGRIDRWVTSHAIEILTKRHQEGKKTTFFVKLSPPTLLDPDFGGWLKNQIEQAKLPSSALVFQLPESGVAAEFSEAESLCMQLQKLGCKIALEHFGTSLGSLQLLGKLSVDYIKIDGSFVQNLALNSANQRSIRKILEPANVKGISVIASYVEDAASLSVLWECGVQFIQGNFLQAPSQEMNFNFSDQLD